MRKKGRNGPGIATLVDSGDPTLASSKDKGSERAVPRTAGAKHEPTERVAARMAARRKRDLEHLSACKSVRRSVRAFKISSPKRSRGSRRSQASELMQAMHRVRRRWHWSTSSTPLINSSFLALFKP